MSTLQKYSRGVITVAAGPQKYISQALNLARSIRVHNPNLRLAVITDSRDPELKSTFDIIHQMDLRLGGPYRQKLCLNRYSKFGQTLFIDSDCLVFRPLEEIFERLRTSSFCVPTIMVSSGVWYRDLAGWLELLGVPSLPRHNSGCFCFADTLAANEFFSTALDYYDRLNEFSIPQTHSGMPDEPAIAMALVDHGISGPLHDSSVQFSPLCGEISSDYSVLRGRMECWRLDRAAVTPFILHCLAGECAQSRYRREAIKLKWNAHHVPAFVCETLVNFYFFVRHGWRGRLQNLLNLRLGQRHGG